MSLIDKIWAFLKKYGPKIYLKLRCYCVRFKDDRGDGFCMTRNKAYRKQLRELEQQLYCQHLQGES